MTVFVTGGSGFLGLFVVREAVRRGHEVLAMARSSRAAESVRSAGGIPVPGNLDEPESLDNAFAVAVQAGAEVLLNIASLGFGHAPVIVAAAEEAGLRRGIFVSTTAVTTTLPATSKRVRLAAEETIARSGLDWTIIRPTMIYGARGDRNISRLPVVLRTTPVIPLPGGGGTLQQPVHVEDLAAMILKGASSPDAVGRTYDVAGPTPISFRDLVLEAAQSVGRRPWLVPVPLGPIVWAMRWYERVIGKPRLKAEQFERLGEDKSFDIGAAARDLNYLPRSFRDGVSSEAIELWT